MSDDFIHWKGQDNLPIDREKYPTGTAPIFALCGAKILERQTLHFSHRLPDCPECIAISPPDDLDRAAVERHRKGDPCHHAGHEKKPQKPS